MNKSNGMKKRIVSTLLVVSVVFLVIAGRLGYLMLIKGEHYKKLAIEQQTRDRLITSKRGTIYDRNGKPIAVSASVETISISPETVRDQGDPEKTATVLSQLLGIEKDVIMAKIEKKTSYESIKKKVEKEIADKVREQKLVGVYLDEDTKRYYPYGDFASHVIGFTGTDNQGLLGIEMIYDNILKGNPGRIVSARNARGSEMPYKYDRYYNPVDGTNIVTTIDQTMQHFLEKNLEAAYINNDLQKGAAGIIMNPKTGEILAMATKPAFDLNDPFTLNNTDLSESLKNIEDDEERQKAQSDALNQMWRNKAVVDSYEPGSTFKIITAAMALETNSVNVESDKFNCGGVLRVGPHDIHCSNRLGHGVQSFQDALKNSCNPAFIQIGQKIGKSNFYKYYRAFGFTEKTGIEMNGETAGMFYPLDSFNEVELATASFGQGPVVTPLQMITAVSAIANNGKLMQPHLIKQFLNDDGEILENIEPKVIREVVSEDTAKRLCQMLENVVEEGGGKRAFIKGYHIGGKTGTSEKIPRGNDKYIASFVGVAPANDPQIACLIILDEPTGDYYGGTIAAPVARDVMQDCLRYLGIEPDDTDNQTVEVWVPGVIGSSISDAAEIITTSKLKYKIEGSGKVIVDQMPKEGVVVAEDATIILYTEEVEGSNLVTVPRLVGMPHKEVVDILATQALKLNIKNSYDENSVAISQSPEGGSKVEPGTTVSVEFGIPQTDND
ncbi:MAG: stage V sporulation protein D [Clostridia bacterium]|nr:stage V sporulation protein D [Clostridia bacterium]